MNDDTTDETITNKATHLVEQPTNSSAADNITNEFVNTAQDFNSGSSVYQSYHSSGRSGYSKKSSYSPDVSPRFKTTSKKQVHLKLYKKTGIECQYIYTLNLKKVSQEITGGSKTWHKLPFAHVHLVNMDSYPEDVVFDIFRMGDNFADYKDGQGDRYNPPTLFKSTISSNGTPKSSSSSGGNGNLIALVSEANLSKIEISSLLMILSANLLNF